MNAAGSSNRIIAENQIGSAATIHQGDTFNFTLPHRPAAAPRPRRPPVRVIPYPRNKDVVRRPDLVDKLDALLAQEDEGLQSAALWGLGGSGKTQIALEYAYRRFKPQGPDPCSVFWVHADTKATFAHDYKTIAAKLGVDGSLAGDDLLKAVRDAIDSEPAWVLVLDNADDLTQFGVEVTDESTSLREYLPQGDHGTILWTSRDGKIADVVGPRQAIHVAKMSTAEALQLLATATNDTRTDESHDQDVQRLLEELQCLPLAVSQAGDFMRRTSTSISEYLSLLQQGQQRREVLGASLHDPHRRDGVPNSLLKTWSISVKRIKAENKTAYKILCVIAYVDNQNIPLELLVASVKQKEGRDVEVKLAVARLLEFSFLTRHQSQTEGDETSYDMHKLVQEATRYSLSVSPMEEGSQGTHQKRPKVARLRTSRLPVSGRRSTSGADSPSPERYSAKKALDVVSKLFPQTDADSGPDIWTKCDKYLAHALAVSEWAQVSGEKRLTADLLISVSCFLRHRGRWREIESVDIKALVIAREVLGKRHPNTLTCLNNLASAYSRLGQLDKAEKMRVKLVGLQRKVFGEKHPKTLCNLVQLAMIYIRQGQYSEAETRLLKVLALQREALGKKHKDTFKSMGYLADTYQHQSRYSEAETIRLKVLASRREVLGMKHPDTITSMECLASTYQHQSRYSEAEKMQVEVLALRRDLLGERHPDTMGTLGSLASIYRRQGRCGEAEKMQVEVLALRRELLGERHPDTMKTLGSLALTYLEQDRFVEAEKIQAHLLGLRREVSGERHMSTIAEMQNLAFTWKDMGRYQEALALMQNCYDLRSSVSGPAHPKTLVIRRRLDKWERQSRCTNPDTRASQERVS